MRFGLVCAWGLVLGFVSASTRAHASESDEHFRASLHLANDSAFLRLTQNTDRFFTSGFGASFTWGGARVAPLMRWLPGDAAFADEQRAFGMVTAQLLFTPQDLTLSPPDPDDHPYAGYLYAGAFFQRANSLTFEHLQLDVGVVGPAALGRETQQVLHRAWGLTQPRGWDAQLENQLTVQATFRKKWRLDLAAVALHSWGPLALQFIPETEISLGIVTRKLELGGLLRVGVALADDFGPHQLLAMGSLTGRRVRAPLSASVYARGTGRVVQGDLFLDGNGPVGVIPEPLVGQAEFGFVFQYFASPSSSWELGYGQVQVSREFTTEYLHHGYGTLSLSWLGAL